MKTLILFEGGHRTTVQGKSVTDLTQAIEAMERSTTYPSKDGRWLYLHDGYAEVAFDPSKIVAVIRVS